jgi:N-sulfoglucosamine sulfohydrolase
VKTLNRRSFLRRAGLGSLSAGLALHASGAAPAGKRPNILFAIADDWSWPHASIHGAPEIETPAFDRVAREGCLFDNVFAVAPQCSPNRAATLTGRYIWQIEEAGTHASIFPKTYPVFTRVLEDSGYHAGYTGKGWSPGDWRRGGWEKNPAGDEYNRRRARPPLKGVRDLDYAANFEDFIEARQDDAPFFFWFGCYEPHRRYEEGSGRKAGKDPEKVKLPPFLPDDPVTRNDVLDYFAEVEHFDSHLGRMLALLEERGELDNTIVVVTSDNGMPFPRAKANLYEFGTHMPMAVRWPGKIRPGSRTDGLVSFADFAPAFLECAGCAVPETMAGSNFLAPVIAGGDPGRQYVQTGRERHTHARRDNLGYPARALRTADWLYIWNCKPDRWPMGAPPEYHDVDRSPSKTFLMEKREDYPGLFAASFAKRPEEELYAIRTDPGCLNNLAADPAQQEILQSLREKLRELLREQQDPRVLGKGDIFESYPRVSHMRPELGGFAERGEYNPAFQPEK